MPDAAVRHADASVWGSAGATYDVDEIKASRPDATEAELAAFATGFHDPRVVAAIPMAGTYRTNWFGQNGYQDVDIPVMAMTGTLDGPESAQEQWDFIQGLDFSWVEIEGGCHQTFGLGLCDELDDETGFHAVNTYILAYSRAHVLGDDSAQTLGILDGSVEVDPIAAFQKK